uniref:Secreted protein n=1 Tax=Anguilla anguilla TaxID=7936 RepID=A0A0E9PQ05_ANGAN
MVETALHCLALLDACLRPTECSVSATASCRTLQNHNDTDGHEIDTEQVTIRSDSVQKCVGSNL